MRYGAIKNEIFKHLAEQTCFNYLLHTTKNYAILDARYNYNLHLGGAWRHLETGRVTTIQALLSFEWVTADSWLDLGVRIDG